MHFINAILEGALSVQIIHSYPELQASPASEVGAHDVRILPSTPYVHYSSSLSSARHISSEEVGGSLNIAITELHVGVHLIVPGGADDCRGGDSQVMTTAGDCAHAALSLASTVHTLVLTSL